MPDLGKRDIGISIHALLAESDYAHAGNILPDQDFYPRSPCGERPVGGAIAADPIYFYPRSPCGERLRDGAVDAKRHAISIHALLAESDNRGRKTAVLRQYFYPRSPCGERLPHGVQNVLQNHFYPRSPCGERRVEYEYR